MDDVHGFARLGLTIRHRRSDLVANLRVIDTLGSHVAVLLLHDLQQRLRRGGAGLGLVSKELRDLDCANGGPKSSSSIVGLEIPTEMIERRGGVVLEHPGMSQDLHSGQPLTCIDDQELSHQVLGSSRDVGPVRIGKGIVGIDNLRKELLVVVVIERREAAQ